MWRGERQTQRQSATTPTPTPAFVRQGLEAVCCTVMGLLQRCLVALSLFALAGAVMSAVTYRWVDAQGVVHYSDTPHPGAEVIQLSGAQTYHGTLNTTPAATPADAAQ